MKISIILDSSESWFVDYAERLRDNLNKKHEVKILYGFNEMTKGDIAFFLSVTKICPSEKLRLNNNNIVIHASDLPKGKGWSPMPWQIIEGENEITLSLFEAVEKVDSGKVYLKDKVVFKGHELIGELREQLSDKIIEMAVRYVDNYNNMVGHEQEGKETFYKKRTPEHSELNVNKTIHEQFNILRTVDNEKYPAFFYKDGIKYIIKIYKD
ncbi:formyltransferase family protein [Peribacillus sp. NPDC097675]|uniref:formyltransferase family protein n=1 Tax=Peribacillus sp. NPDC097675 TaxID=3390618 RepID=UPI003D06BF8B